MRSVEARLGKKIRAARTMKDKLSELKDRIAKVQTIQRSANEMRERENGPNSQIKETVGSERFSGLDFLRAFALLMGVLLHALSMYLEPADRSEPRPIAGILFVWIHTWRMPLFMLLAGFFTALSLKKRTLWEYTLNRWIRLSVPFLILWIAIPAVDETADTIFVLPDLVSLLMHHEAPKLRLDHLWFLYYLLIYYSLFAITNMCFGSYVGWLHLSKLTFSKLLLLWLPLLILLAPHYKPTGGIFAEIPTQFGDIHAGSLLFLSIFFIMGMQLMNSQEFLSTLQLRKFIIPILILFSFVPIALIGWGIMKDHAFSFDSSAEMWVVNGLATCSTVFLVLALIGSANRWFTANGPILSWLIRLSYPVYVFHLVFVYSVGGYLMFAGLNATMVVLMSAMAGIIGPTIIYYLLIKRTPLNWVFNGYKHSQFKLKNEATLKRFL